MGGVCVGVAVDNDVLLKAACYGLGSRLWPAHAGNGDPGVLGAARFVLAIGDSARLGGAGPGRRGSGADGVLPASGGAGADGCRARRGRGTRAACTAARRGARVGESQLAAMVAARDIPWLDTGDKRAVRGLETLVARSQTCARLCGRVRCLEQLLVLLLDEAADEYDAIAAAICGEPTSTRRLASASAAIRAAEPSATRRTLPSRATSQRFDAQRRGSSRSNRSTASSKARRMVRRAAPRARSASPGQPRRCQARFRRSLGTPCRHGP